MATLIRVNRIARHCVTLFHETHCPHINRPLVAYPFCLPTGHQEGNDEQEYHAGCPEQEPLLLENGYYAFERSGFDLEGDSAGQYLPRREKQGNGTGIHRQILQVQ